MQERLATNAANVKTGIVTSKVFANVIPVGKAIYVIADVQKDITDRIAHKNVRYRILVITNAIT